MRTFHSYLAKFPRAALDVLPEVRAAIDELLRDDKLGTIEAPEVEEAERQLASAAGRPRKPRRDRGQESPDR